MDFFGRLGEKISSTSKDIAGKAKEMMDVASMNSAITAEENKITQAQKEIGALYFEMYKDAPAPEFAEKVEAIKASLQLIEQQREEISRLKGVVKCQNCETEIPADNSFCSNCGAPNEKAAEQEPAGETQESTETPAEGAVEEAAPQAEPAPVEEEAGSENKSIEG